MDQQFLLNCRQVIVLERQGHLGEARIQEQLLRKQSRSYGPFAGEAAAYQWMVGELALLQGDPRKATSLLAEAMKMADGLGASREEKADLLIDVYNSLGRAALQLQNPEAAVKTLAASIKLARKLDGPRSWSRVIAPTPKLAGAMYLSDNPRAEATLDWGLKQLDRYYVGDRDKWLFYLRQSLAMLTSVGQSDKANYYRDLLDQFDQSDQPPSRAADYALASEERRES